MLPKTGAGQELEIDADSFEGESNSQLRAKGARLRYGDYILQADELLYDSVSGWVQANDDVHLEDGAANLLRADSIEYFPLLSRAVAQGNVRFDSDDGVQLWAHLIRYELLVHKMFVSGDLRVQDRVGNLLFADTIEYHVAAGEAFAQGNVRVETPAGITISAAQLEYAAKEQRVTAPGKMRFSDAGGIVITGKDLHYAIAERRGSVDEVEMRTLVEEALVTAAVLQFEPAGYTMQQAFYTTCSPDDPAWLLEAESITVDDNNVAHATDVLLRFYGLPVFYLPSMSYIMSNERRSGILSTKLSVDDDGEFGFEIPYYLNLAPNYDAIVSGHYLSDRGIRGVVSGRWLLAQGSGSVEVGGINDDVNDDFRSHWEIIHNQNYGDGYQFGLEASGVSDDTYGGDFFENHRSAKRHYLRSVSFGRKQPNWYWKTSVVNFQTIQPQKTPVTEPYNILPSLEGGWTYYGTDFDLHTTGRFDKFHRKGDAANGHRFNGNASVERTYTYGGSHSLKLSAGAAGSSYKHKSASWAVPYASADLRPQLWSNWSLGDKQLRQLFEPRLYVGVVQREDFSDVPVYDSLRFPPGYQDYFSINPFVGGDRFEDASFASFGLETKLWSPERNSSWLSGRIAQRYRSRDSTVQAGSEAIPQKGFSNVLAEARLDPDHRNTYLGRLEWNPDVDSFQQANFEMQHRSDAGHVYNLNYSRSRTSATSGKRGEVSLGLLRNLSTQVQLAIAVNYDIDSSEYTKIDGGLKYVSDCRCWGVSFFVEHEPKGSKDKTAYYLQIDLRGLGGLGSSNYGRLAQKIKEPL